MSIKFVKRSIKAKPMKLRPPRISMEGFRVTLKMTLNSLNANQAAGKVSSAFQVSVSATKEQVVVAATKWESVDMGLRYVKMVHGLSAEVA